MTATADGKPAPPIGTTKGPGESAGDFTIVTPDRDRAIKVGEFVYYWADVDGSEQRIFGRVASRTHLRLYPDSFMADPTTSPDEVARILGFESADTELYEVSVSIMGHFSATMGFVNPRIAPPPGLPIYLAEPHLLAEVISRKRPGDIGAVHLGSLLTRRPDEVPISMDANEFTNTHLAIIAGTGAGKSYLAGVIVEELLRPNNAAAVLIIDPHGEYETLEQIPNISEFHRNDSEIEYRPEVKIIRAGELVVRRNLMRDDDILYLLGDLSTPQQVIAREALGSLRKKREKWVLNDLHRAIEDVDVARLGGGRAGQDGQEEYWSSKQALSMKLRNTLGRRGVFDDHKHTSMQTLLRPGRCSVLQVGEMDRRSQQIVVATILRRAFEGRQQTKRGSTNPDDELHIPFPIFVLIEGAHHFAPAGGDVATTNLLKEILAEGRKFDMGIGLITQRPGKLDQDVLSQCMTQCIMRIVNPVDQAAVAAAVESVGRELLVELPALSRGQAIISGAAINATVLCRVRERLTQHGGASSKSAEMWTSFFRPENARRRKVDDALFPDSGRSSEPDLATELFGDDGGPAG